MDHSLEGLGLALNTPQRREFVAVPMSQSGLGNVSGILTHVGLATLDEIPASGLKGRIALAKRDVIRFQVRECLCRRSSWAVGLQQLIRDISRIIDN